MLRPTRIFTAAFVLLTACAGPDPLPERASAEELDRLLESRLAAVRGTEREDDVRRYGLPLQAADGTFAEERGRVLVLPEEDGAFLLGFYAPEGEGFRRVGEPVRMEDVGTPRVGNPRDGGTCLRAPRTDGAGERFACVVRGEVVTGEEARAP